MNKKALLLFSDQSLTKIISFNSRLVYEISVATNFNYVVNPRTNKTSYRKYWKNSKRFSFNSTLITA